MNRRDFLKAGGFALAGACALREGIGTCAGNDQPVSSQPSTSQPAGMPDAIELRARRTRNRGDIHVFLGHPLSDGCDKVTVEPGNSFSPGVWTCGVTVGIETGGRTFTPDSLKAPELSWGFATGDGCPPVLEAKYAAGPALNVVHRLTYLGGEGAEGVTFSEVLVTATAPAAARLGIVVRDVGPAGGKIQDMSWSPDERTLLLNRDLRLRFEEPPTDAKVWPPDAEHDSPMGVVAYALEMQRGESRRIAFKAEHGFAERIFGGSIPLRRPFNDLSVRDGFAKSVECWNEALPARVFAPDARVARVWERQAYHLLAAMECGLPRIGAVDYPVFWIRDGAVALRALDIVGRRDLARIGNEYLAPLDFSGGFGAESDAIGEGIWTLWKHAEFTGDTAWLAGVFPNIVRRVDWLQRMLTAKEPIRRPSADRMPGYMPTPGVNIVCLPAEDGLVRGRMDWHSADFFINCWTFAGLSCAAQAARRLDRNDLAENWTKAAQDLDQAIRTHLLPRCRDARDAIVTPHPTGALIGDIEPFRRWFRSSYRSKRLTPTGVRKKDDQWSYFEAAQIHNAMLLGLQKEAWISFEGMLDDGAPWGVSACGEGPPKTGEYLLYRNDLGRRGWLDSGQSAACNMPHIWTAAELLLLIRDLFVQEDGDGVVLGPGVPWKWLQPGSRFGVQNMPTSRGPVSYTVTIRPNGQASVEYAGEARYRTAFNAGKQ